MNIVDTATQNQIKNLQKRSGKTLDELLMHIKNSGLTRHGEIRDLLKRDFAMGHGDANMLTHFYLGSSAAFTPPSGEDDLVAAVDALYQDDKAVLRPVHDSVMAAIHMLGHFEIAPKKGYLSLRRKKQFAMLGPASRGRIEIGLNMKDMPASVRLIPQAAGGMCQYKVYLTRVEELDDEVKGWLKTAFEGAV